MRARSAPPPNEAKVPACSPGWMPQKVEVPRVKDQYVGDINDFFKYAFLRGVEGQLSAPLLVCWMATSDDGGTDGRKRAYLNERERYRAIDAALFDGLELLVATPLLDIAAVEGSGLLSTASFFPQRLGDAKSARSQYFETLWAELVAGSIVFFDPDNGLEIRSTAKGRRASSKFLFLDEMETAGADSRSVVVYQHFGRVQRDPFARSQLKRIGDVLPHHDLLALVGSHIAFLVASSIPHTSGLECAAKDLCVRWPGLRIVRLSD
jgi:hypothetical protein